jgi:3-oxoacyl-[acyl-carrier-protein] synthase II
LVNNPSKKVEKTDNYSYLRQKRVVITGLGVISPVGIGKDEFWKNLFSGRSNFKKILLFDTSVFEVKTAGEVTGFKAEEYLGDKGLRDFNRSAKLVCSAGSLALDDAILSISNSNNERIGISLGVTLGSIKSLCDFHKEILISGPRLVNPSAFPNTVFNAPASRLAIKFGIKGPNNTINTGECAGIDALDYAIDLINFGRADIVLCGAVEELSLQTFLGFYKTGQLAGLNGKPLINCPFDKRRNGIIFSEGAAVLILESLDSALERNANIYAEIKGIGSYFFSLSCKRHFYLKEGMVRSMEIALDKAHIGKNEIDSIIANANSTQEADLGETLAIKQVFGSLAYSMPICSPKSVIGEPYSAWGCLGAAAALGSIQTGRLSPNTSYQVRDSLCDLTYVVKNNNNYRVNNIMVNAFDCFGGASSVVLSRYDQ